MAKGENGNGGFKLSTILISALVIINVTVAGLLYASIDKRLDAKADEKLVTFRLEAVEGKLDALQKALDNHRRITEGEKWGR